MGSLEYETEGRTEKGSRQRRRMSQSERKTGVEVQVGRRDSDMRIPLRRTATLNPEVREEAVWGGGQNVV